jgi:hypothetical protein
MTGHEPEWFTPDVADWDPWSPQVVARRLASVSVPWYVAAGWAIDLFLGGSYRAHDDLEIGVPQARFGEVAAALNDLDFFVVGDGRAWPLDRAGKQIDEHHQTWARERATGRWRLDVFREPSAHGTWVYRRDHRLQVPYDEVILWTASGIPYARPEVVLVFKAMGRRPKDDADFEAVRPWLGTDARRWLGDALELVAPGHPWRTRL